MGKDKLRKFAENLTFDNLIQPEFNDIFHRDHPLKGRWAGSFFGAIEHGCGRDSVDLVSGGGAADSCEGAGGDSMGGCNSAIGYKPIVLELGCGKGEYTVGLGAATPEKSFLGVDIKGARMWRGAKTATEMGLRNVGFLRTRIEFIESFFGPGEVSEIWITFPDPQLKKGREKKRLTSSLFLKRYARFLKSGGTIHLKTDSRELHDYTRKVIAVNALPLEIASADIYAEGLDTTDPALKIKTAYERRFLDEGKPITYLRFGLGASREFRMVYDD